MTSVSLRPTESQEQLFKRFKKKVMRGRATIVLDVNRIAK